MKLQIISGKNGVFLKKVMIRFTYLMKKSGWGTLLSLFFLLPLAIQPLQGHTLPIVQEDIMLSEALHRLSQKYKVFFSYDEKMIEEVEVSYEPEQYRDIEHALEELLSGTSLRYKIFDNRYIILYEESQEAITSLKGMVRHLESVIDSQEERTLSRKYDTPVPMLDRVSGMNIEPLAFNVSGTVTDQSGEPLIGVNIQVKGTTKGTSTDIDGHFVLDDIDENAVLVVSYIGYQTQEVVVAGKSTISIILTSDSQLLDEVVVVGYVEKEKGELTGAVSSLKGDLIEQTSQSNLTQSLQGKVPGLIVNNRGGIPGSDDANILVRGQSTLGNNSPLIIIDGVPRESFSHLAPSDIESISVLKDAAAAIYGARAANGVIVVKTKSGKAGTSEIRITSNIMGTGLTKIPQYMNSFEYATWENEIAERYGMVKQWTDEDLQKFKSGSNPNTHPNTDFYNEVFKKWGLQSRNNLTFSGGEEKYQYFVSADILDQNGLYKSDDLTYDQYQIRSNVKSQISKNINIGLNLVGRIEKQHSTAKPIESLIPFMITWAYPYNTGYYPNGLPGVGGPEGQNPVIISSDEAGWNEHVNKIFRSILSVNLKLDWITSGLSFDGYGSFDYDITNGENFRRPWTVYNYNEADNEYYPQIGNDQGVGKTTTLNKYNNEGSSRLFHFRLNYENSFGNHNINTFIAYEQQESDYSTLSGFRRDLVSRNKVELFTGGPALLNNDGSSSESGRVNYFGSISYNFMRKYLLDFTLRRDGSFNFPDGKRFGIFPGISVAWNLSEEQFLEGTNDWLDQLKIRISYAKLGNDRIPAFQYLTQYSLNRYYIFGESLNRENGFSITNTANPNITWEISNNSNIGIDGALWNSTFGFSLDYFQEQRRNILITRNASIPDYTALELPLENLGKVDNKGFEFIFNYGKAISNNMNFGIGGNFTYNNNKIIYMDEPATVNEYRKREGHPMNSWVVYNTDGIYTSKEEIENSPHLAGTLPGDIKYIDVNGDGEITGDDRVRKYTSQIPTIQYGFNLAMGYKSLEMNAFFSGQAGAETMIKYVSGGNKPRYLFEDRWTAEKSNATKPRAFIRNDVYQTKDSDFWLYDASFIRLSNLEIAYNFNSKLLERINIKKLRIHVRGTNLFTSNLIEGTFDPEVVSLEGSYYPQNRMITGGLSLTL